MDTHELTPYVINMLTPEVSRFFVGAGRQAYRHRELVRSGYADPIFGAFTAGNAVSSHLHDIVSAQIENRVPGAKVMVNRDRSPHPEVLVRIDQLLIGFGARPHIPAHASMPTPTKRRRNRAWYSALLPQQRSLFNDDPIVNADASDYIFALIVHAGDERTPSEMATMSLCVVDQLYQVAIPPIDLISRSRAVVHDTKLVQAIRPLDIVIKRDGTNGNQT